MKEISSFSILSLYFKYTKGFRLVGLATIVLYMMTWYTESALVPLEMKHVVNALFSHDFNYAKSSVYWCIFFIMAGFFICRIGDMGIVSFESKHAHAVRTQAFSGLIKHEIGFFEKNHVGVIIGRFKRFVGGVEILFDDISYVYTVATVQVSSTMYIVSFLSFYFLSLYTVWLIVYLLFIFSTFKERNRLNTIEADQDSRFSGALSDIVTNVITVKTNGKEEHEKVNIEKMSRKSFDTFRSAWKFENKIIFVEGVMGRFLQISSVLLGVYLCSVNICTPGDVVLVFAFSSTLASTLRSFGKGVKRFSKVMADAKEFYEIIDRAPLVQDGSNAIDNPDTSAFEIEFRNITFSYEELDKNAEYGEEDQEPINNVFSNFNLTVPSGQKIAIVGGSGSGKTTLARLLLRFMDPSEGQILVNGYDIRRDLTRIGLSKFFAYIPQSITLFSNTVAFNIGYGGKDINDEHLEISAKKAQAYHFIESLSHGFLTMLGPHGVNLSGGQRQRIAIARELGRGAKIVILDEATSALDTRTEQKFQEIIKSSMGEKTVIIIAHRLSTVKDCNRIVVLEKGAIVEDGTHEELLEKGGYYYRLVNPK